MARFFKKRRSASGPTKNEERTRRTQEKKSAAPSVAERFPSASRLTLRLGFRGSQGQLLSEEVRSFGPGDPCVLTVDCPGLCGGAEQDLSARVDALAAAGGGSVEFDEPCPAEKTGAPEPCGALLRARIELTLKP